MENWSKIQTKLIRGWGAGGEMGGGAQVRRMKQETRAGADWLGRTLGTGRANEADAGQMWGQRGREKLCKQPKKAPETTNQTWLKALEQAFWLRLSCQLISHLCAAVMKECRLINTRCCQLVNSTSCL